MFASVEQVRNDFARVQHRVSFGAIPEYKALEQDDLKEGPNDETSVDENAHAHLSTDTGGWKDQLDEDDP